MSIRPLIRPSSCSSKRRTRMSCSLAAGSAAPASSSAALACAMASAISARSAQSCPSTEPSRWIAFSMRLSADMTRLPSSARSRGFGGPGSAFDAGRIGDGSDRGSLDIRWLPRHNCMNLHDRPESAIATMKDRPQHSTDGFAVRLGLFYAAIFLFGGIQLPFFPVWLESRGLDPRAIGLVVAVPMIVRIVVVPIVGYEADRRRALQAALLAVSMAGVLAMTVVGLVDGPVAILIAYAAAAVAFTPVLPLTDAYALSGLAIRGGAYGPVRLWGSVAFIVGNVGAGMLLAWIAPGHLIWLMVGALAFCAAAAAALVPLDDGGSGAAASRRPRELMKIPAFAAVAAVAALVQPSHAAYYAFSTVAWRDAGLSGA